MEAIIEQFKIWMTANSLESATISCYISDIRLFFNETKVTKLEEITEQVIIEYFAKIKLTSSLTLLGRRRSALQTFLTRFQKLDIRCPHVKKPMRKPVEVITEDVFENVVLPMVDREWDNAVKIKAVLSFMYYSGLRRCDTASIKRSAIDFENGIITATIKKQNITKKIPFSKKLKQILIKYFASEAEEQSAFNMSKVQIQRIFQKFSESLPELDLHAHKFRKSWATNAYRMGMKIEQIQAILGHKSIETTFIYVQQATEDENIKDFHRLESEQIKQQRKRNHDKPQS